MPDFKPLDIIQDLVSKWAISNFGHTPPWEQILGIMEEGGELAHHYLKKHQGIRIEEDHDLGIKDAIGDMFVYMCHFCSREGISIEDCVNMALEEIHERDWKKNPKDGK